VGNLLLIEVFFGRGVEAFGRIRGRCSNDGMMRSSIALALLPLAACAGGDRAASFSRPPNVIFILADDLGYGDLGCYGQEKIRTPHIDRLAAEGMRFTQFYSGNAVCAPSRSCLMTGKHPGHASIRNNGNPPERGAQRIPDYFPAQNPIPDEDVTIAEMLKAKGYATGATGKWGLGYEGSSGDPNRQGFDLWYGYYCQGHAHNHYPTHLYRNGEAEALPGNTHGATGQTYAQDRFTEVALDFIRDNRSKPFFLFLPFIIPHVSIQVPEESLAEYKGKFPEGDYEDRSNYIRHPAPHAGLAAMISHLDRAVGKVMDLVRDLGLDGDTAVFFSSDNGPVGGRVGGADAAFFKSKGPLRDFKGSLYEGGIRVPMIVRWPGRIRAGAASEHAGANWDVMPTVAELTGTAAPGGIDGLSFAPELLGRSQKPHDFLYWEFPAYGGQQALRMGSWKAVRQKLMAPNAVLKTELYDLSKDLGETTDVAAANPDVVRRAEEIFRREHVPSAVFPFPALDREAPSVWVDNVKGRDENDGRTQATAFRTLKRGAAALEPGLTLRLVRNAEPYREPLEIRAGGTPGRPVVIDGQGSLLTGLDPAPADRWVPHEAGILKAPMPEFHRGQPRAVVDGKPLESEGTVRELHEGKHTWVREMLYVALPEGAKWPGAEIAFMTRDRGVVIDGASHVVVRNLAVEQVSGDAFAVRGEAKGVRLENVEGRLARGGLSRGLFAADRADVTAVGSRFHSNSAGVAAIHRTRTVLDRCEIRDNAHFGTRVNGVEHAFVHCRFSDNGAYDLEAVSLSPESSNGGGPCRARVENGLFRGKSRAGLSVRTAEFGGGVELRASVFLKAGTTALAFRGGGYEGDLNLFSGALEDRDQALDLGGWRLSMHADGASRQEESPSAAGPWRIGPVPVGPRP
jgi:arylsulfatase